MDSKVQSVYSQECKNEGFKWSVSRIFTMKIQRQRKTVQPTISNYVKQIDPKDSDSKIISQLTLRVP